MKNHIFLGGKPPVIKKKGGGEHTTTTFPHPHFSCWIWASDDFFSRDIWPKGSGKEYKVTATSSSAYDSFTLDFTPHLLRREPIPFPPPHLVIIGTALVLVFHIFFFPAVGSRARPSLLHAMQESNMFHHTRKRASAEMHGGRQLGSTDTVSACPQNCFSCLLANVGTGRSESAAVYLWVPNNWEHSHSDFNNQVN